jgi:hypothetical protein
MILTILILCTVCVGLTFFGLWALRRLNIYIGKLEDQIIEQLDRIDELEDMLSQANIKNKKVVRKQIIPDDED